MAQVITIAGERLFALKAQNNEQLDIDTFIFANVPGQDPNATIDRNEGLPPVAQRVHQQIVQQVGRINDNVVVYSTVLDSVTGPFDFNWVGLYSSANQTLIAVSHIPNVSKTITAPGTAGNTLNRNFGIEYSGIADLAGITVQPETWQLDFTARLSGMDELTRQLAADMNGKDWFIEDGFKVVPRSTTNTFKVTPGAGYVSGLRVELVSEHILTVSSYPQFVYVDAWFDGDASSQWKPKTAFTVTNGEMDDYIDVNGKQHYVFKLARITAADVVEDLRDKNGIAGKIYELKSNGLRERIFDAIGGIVSIQYDGGYVNAVGAAWDLHRARGIPADFAIDGDTINDSAILRSNLNTLIKAQREGARFSSHGLNVQGLGDGTSKKTIAYEIQESKRVLQEMGLDIDGFVAPQGQFDQSHVNLAENEYTWLAGEANIYNGNPADSVFGKNGDIFNIHRVNMGSTALIDLKEIIDYCIKNDEWVVFYDHSPGNTAGPVPPASISLSDLTNLLDYIKESGIRTLTTSDAISTQFKGAAYGYKLKGIADNVAKLNGRLNDARNLLLDTDFASRLNSSSPWKITNSITGTTSINNTKSTVEDRIVFNFNGDGDGSGELVLMQDIVDFRKLTFGSGITFAIEFLGNNVTNGAEVSVGLRVIDTSDGSTLDAAEIQYEYKDNRARRMHVSLKNHGELNNQTVTIRACVRVAVPDASKQFTATVINPRLSETASAAEYRPNRDSGLTGTASSLNSTILPSGSWEQIDFSATNISELYRVSPGRYAVPTPGTYLVSLNIAVSAADPFGARIVSNTGKILNEGRGVNGCSSTAFVKLSLGDYFDVQARQLTGANINFSIAYLSAIRIK
ncbi:phage tail protein [Shewanella sp.]|uniref:phage tail-collar fiber domain-containing protein n=1 Tax=Shewanella sp. TaxID=50422 RepID=UPI0035642075